MEYIRNSINLTKYYYFTNFLILSKQGKKSFYLNQIKAIRFFILLSIINLFSE